MTEITLNVNHEITLPKVMSSLIYNTNDIRNYVELQTLEKGFQKIPASSKDSSSLTFNLPSISGGWIKRTLGFEIPINWSVTFENFAPQPSLYTGPNVGTWPANSNLASWNLGGNVRPFLSVFNAIDQFPLSKIFGIRTYRFNNSSTSLREELSPEQVDLMVAQMDIEKMINDGLAVFADSNSHFNLLSFSCGGLLLSDYFVGGASTAATKASRNILQDEYLGTGGLTALPRSINSTLEEIFRNKNKQMSKIENTWFLKRNSARNIISDSVSFTGLQNGAFAGYTLEHGSDIVPVRSALVTTGLTSTIQCAYYQSGTAITANFSKIIREQCISQFFDHDYNFKEFSWNDLIPLSSFDMKMNFNLDYLQNGLLKIGDYTNSFTSYTLNTVTVGAQSDCYFILEQCKVPLALQTRDSYKICYYDQVRPQTKKDAGLSGNVISAEMQFANLSQIPDYLFIFMPIDKASYLTALGGNNQCQLPTVFNLPITNLNITFGSDTNLGTYDMDMPQLQKLTLENLQENKHLRDLIIGKSEPFVGFSPNNWTATSPNALTTDAQYLDAIQFALRNLGTEGEFKGRGSGISNSSFYILKLGSQLRLKDGYTSGMIVNYNMTVKASCDLTSKYLRNSGLFTWDMEQLNAIKASVKSSLEVVHFLKKIYTLSGSAMQNLYNHDITISSSKYDELRTNYESAFKTNVRDEMPFGTDMMIGGSFLSSLKDKASKALSYLRPRIEDALKKGRMAVDFAKENVSSDSSLRKYIDLADQGLKQVGAGGSMDPQVVSGGAKRGRASGSSSQSQDWKKYLQDM